MSAEDLDQEDEFCHQHEECDNETWEESYTLAEDGSPIPVNRCPECGIRWDRFVLQQSFASHFEE